MRTQRSMTVGLVVTDVRNPYFAELAMALEYSTTRKEHDLYSTKLARINAARAH